MSETNEMNLTREIKALLPLLSAGQLETVLDITEQLVDRNAEMIANLAE